MISSGIPTEILLEIFAGYSLACHARISQVIFAGILSKKNCSRCSPDFFFKNSTVNFSMNLEFEQRFPTLILLGITPKIHPEISLEMPLGISSEIAIWIVLEYTEIVFKHIETFLEVSS